MNSNPVVSVIIPCFNAEGHIRPAIESILNQTFKDVETIVVDDGSTDKTKEVLFRYSGNIRYIYQKNSGPAVARNRGILDARGDYIAFCDADDLWESQKLEKQMSVFKNIPECAMVGTNGIFVGGDSPYENRPIAPSRLNGAEVQIIDFKDMLKNGKIYPSTVVIKKEALLGTGLLFDSLTYFFENVQLWLRIAKKYKVAFINEPLIKRKYHDSSLSHKYAKANGYAQIKVYSAALLDFPEFRDLIKKKLSHSQYTVARQELIDGYLNAARALLIECLKYNKLFGRNYFKKSDTYVSKLKKIITPYLLLIVSVLPQHIAGALFKSKRKNMEVRPDTW